MSKISLTVDILLIGYRQGVHILLIERKHSPYKGCWALPGGFVEEDETLVTAAHRELKEETGVANVQLNSIATFDAPQRDPRGRTVSTVFWGVVPRLHRIKAGSDAQKARWFSLENLPELAFDHQQIIATVQKNLQAFYVLAIPVLENLQTINISQLCKILDDFCNHNLLTK